MNTMTFEQFLLNVPTDKAYNVVEQYNAVTSYGEVEADGSQDATYKRNSVEVKNLSNATLLNQLVQQVEADSVTVKGKNFSTLVETAIEISKNNYGAPDTLIQIDNNRYLLLQNDAECVRLKLLNPTQGAIVCYTPNRFILIERTDV